MWVHDQAAIEGVIVGVVAEAHIQIQAWILVQTIPDRVERLVSKRLDLVAVRANLLANHRVHIALRAHDDEERPSPSMP